MERDLRSIETGGMRAPPGFCAHLGMLYAEIGNHEGAIFYLTEEKNRFPESEFFMNRLLSRYGEENDVRK
ncbi:MAG: DUF4810 domain-containing protein [Treponema sp.]|nr:DUF4810 domain-containing protein [Treponema sp.]